MKNRLVATLTATVMALTSLTGITAQAAEVSTEATVSTYPNVDLLAASGAPICVSGQPYSVKVLNYTLWDFDNVPATETVTISDSMDLGDGTSACYIQIDDYLYMTRACYTSGISWVDGASGYELSMSPETDIDDNVWENFYTVWGGCDGYWQNWHTVPNEANNYTRYDIKYTYVIDGECTTDVNGLTHGQTLIYLVYPTEFKSLYFNIQNDTSKFITSSDVSEGSWNYAYYNKLDTSVENVLTHYNRDVFNYYKISK